MSSNGLVITEDNLQRVKALIFEMESGNEEQAGKKLDDIVRIRESGLYMELGKLTRDLHDSLNGFKLDTRVNTLAEKEIPDAKERLNHVLDLTEKAADTTLDIIEKSLPICNKIEENAIDLNAELKIFRNKEMSVEGFRKFLKSLNIFLEEAENKNNDLKGNLNEVLLAQSFQDLTGQIIRRVITLVTEVEDKLVDIIKVVGKTMNHEEPEEESPTKAEGPHIASIDKGDYVSGQDEVDDLLSSLGF